MSQFWLIKSKDQILERLQYFKQFLEDEWNWEHPVVWEPKRYQNKRTRDQNSLVHLWFRELANHFAARGADIDEERMKELMVYQFLGTSDIQINRTTIPGQLRKTSDLDKGEMQEFMDKVLAWGLDHGVKMTVPGDSEYMRLKEC